MSKPGAGSMISSRLRAACLSDLAMASYELLQGKSSGHATGRPGRKALRRNLAIAYSSLQLAPSIPPVFPNVPT